MPKPKFITELSKHLSLDLPGWTAQKHLMPEGREREKATAELHPAAVLIALYEHEGQWVFPLIKRSADGFAHSGQIALPGGRREGTENDIQTALREAHEEVNILPEDIEVLGKISPLPIPVSNHLVQPIVGFAKSKPNLQPEPREVADIFTVSVKLLTENEVKFESWNFRGRDWEIPLFMINGYKVWGATAMILSEFRELLIRIDGDSSTH